MNILDFINRTPIPAPWAEGDKIPWNEPAFSTRMLHEHLSQEHDAASRRTAVIDRQVDWIFQTLLSSRPVPVLDLGCGPGLYTSRLARRGCRCTGIDFSPASIAYAQDRASQENLDCRYLLGDLRTAEFKTGVGLVMLIFGELNVFRPAEARLILKKAYQALDPGGLLVLEPHPFDAVRKIGQSASSWYGASSGLFSASPHLYLQENFWDDPTSTATTRYFIVDASTGKVSHYAATMQAYSDDGYRALLQGLGFQQVEFHPSLEGREVPEMKQLFSITARK